MHSTDFLVWNNFGAELEAPAEVSCTGLGTYLLGWAGLPKPLYFQWVSAAMEEMTLYRERLFVAADGTPSHTPPENCEPLVAAWRKHRYTNALRGTVHYRPAHRTDGAFIRF